LAGTVTAGFPPLIGARPRVLILGSLPSVRSLERHEYYGHPRNAFWPIMGELFGAFPEMPYCERTRIVTGEGLAIWDVLAASVRPGSQDSAIDVATATANDIAGLLRERPGISLVCFNGRTAEKLFRRLVAPHLESGSNTPQFRPLPSTSPAHASMRFEAKLARWHLVRNAVFDKQGE